MQRKNLLKTFALCTIKSTKYVLIALGLIAPVSTLSATDLTIKRANTPAISRKTVEYQCDSTGTKMGVPAGPFPVEYLNGGGNSLVVVPVAGNSLIFSNVFAGSGARYVAQQFTWWEAHGSVTLSSDSLAGKSQSTCKPTGK